MLWLAFIFLFLSYLAINSQILMVLNSKDNLLNWHNFISNLAIHQLVSHKWLLKILGIIGIKFWRRAVDFGWIGLIGNNLVDFGLNVVNWGKLGLLCVNWVELGRFDLNFSYFPHSYGLKKYCILVSLLPAIFKFVIQFWLGWRLCLHHLKVNSQLIARQPISENFQDLKGDELLTHL